MMGYSHMFYGVDLEQLREIPGSDDRTLYQKISGGEDSLETDERDALKRIIKGNCQHEEGTKHLYGYALKAICEEIGEMVGEDVYAVRDHPYKSKLIANGAPIDIPYDGSDFPEIGYLEQSELEAEYQLATETKPRAKKTFVGFLLRRLSGGAIGREMDAEDVAEDMEAYAATLKECMDKKLSLVSFRH
ncbi:MAG: hypothetical protein HUJ26_13160 [Planctomycetaceae bacterium]|nr:hypothetical protein [Planctomycetaceae bacterium]